MNSMLKSRLPDTMKRTFSEQLLSLSTRNMLIYGSFSGTLTIALEQRLNGNYTRILHEILNRSWKDHLNNKEIYGNIPDICTSIRHQRLRFSWHCWKSKFKLALDVIISLGNLLMVKEKEVDPAGPMSISLWTIHYMM